jgi:hypothetical protein
MEHDSKYLSRQAKTLLDRLERLSADSKWAHRASGYRGSLIRSLANLEQGNPDPTKIEDLIRKGNKILILAAREIPDHDPISK